MRTIEIEKNAFVFGLFIKLRAEFIYTVVMKVFFATCQKQPHLPPPPLRKKAFTFNEPTISFELHNGQVNFAN